MLLLQVQGHRGQKPFGGSRLKGRRADGRRLFRASDAFFVANGLPRSIAPLQQKSRACFLGGLCAFSQQRWVQGPMAAKRLVPTLRTCRLRVSKTCVKRTEVTLWHRPQHLCHAKASPEAAARRGARAWPPLLEGKRGCATGARAKAKHHVNRSGGKVLGQAWDTVSHQKSGRRCAAAGARRGPDWTIESAGKTGVEDRPARKAPEAFAA
jgi:hypothetical protein